MIAEESLENNGKPKISVSKKQVEALIIKLLMQNVSYFKKYLSAKYHKKESLNEDDFTQMYVSQALILIRARDYPFNIGSQYQDVYNLGTGISDFFFFPNEQGISTESIFSVESKRLPLPSKKREKEYVIGESHNGGIERYKTEKHGKGLKRCELLGFIEKNIPEYWHKTINQWIKDLSTANNKWEKDEILSKEELTENLCHLESIAHRKLDDISLFHLWIVLN